MTKERQKIFDDIASNASANGVFIGTTIGISCQIPDKKVAAIFLGASIPPFLIMTAKDIRNLKLKGRV